jgi:CubicO group peptidase (beta-lactamase class C family)
MRTDPAAGLESFLDRWVAEGEVTAAFGAIATPSRMIWSGAAAAAGSGVPSASSLFDAASLTKPWIATLALALDASGELALDTPVEAVWPRCAEALARRTLLDLLRHRAGFVPWAPLYRRCRSRAAVEELLLGGELVEPAPIRGPRAAGRSRPLQRYSDLDYLLWGFAAERRAGSDLATLLRRAVLEPLGVRGVEAAPGARPDVVPCRCDNAREVELAAALGLRVARRGPPSPGEPQDGNARFLEGRAGHAGLFVTGEAMAALGREWLAAWNGGGALLGASAVRGALGGRGEYALGWARRRARGSAGPSLSSTAFGHVGFTGTSLWIDPERAAVFVLLAHRRVASGQLNPARRAFHALTAALVDARARSRRESGC